MCTQRAQYKYAVCITCFTYNQAAYIEETLNGFCSQKTDFPFVCLVTDDASTDGEHLVLRRYVDENFDISDKTVAYEKETDYANIQFAQHKENKNCFIAILLLKENHYRDPEKFKGKKLEYLKEWRHQSVFECFCEGDDYWTDIHKLQDQVGILRDNDNVSLVHCGAVAYNQGDGTFGITLGKKWDTILNLLMINTVCTLTVCFRSKDYDDFNAEVDDVCVERKWMMGDFPFWIWLTLRGEVVFIDRIVGVYRVLRESASHTKNIDRLVSFQENVIEICDYFADKISLPEKKRKIYRGKYNLSMCRIMVQNMRFDLFTNRPFFTYLINMVCYFAYKAKLI